MPHHVFRDGGFGSLNAQLEQLTVNAWCTPARVGCGSSSGSDPEPLAARWADLACRGRFSTSRTSESLTMPGDNGFRLDDHQGGFPVAPHATQPDPEDPVGGRQPQASWSRPTQDGELLPQGEVFQS